MSNQFSFSKMIKSPSVIVGTIIILGLHLYAVILFQMEGLEFSMGLPTTVMGIEFLLLGILLIVSFCVPNICTLFKLLLKSFGSITGGGYNKYYALVVAVVFLFFGSIMFGIGRGWITY